MIGRSQTLPVEEHGALSDLVGSSAAGGRTHALLGAAVAGGDAAQPACLATYYEGIEQTWEFWVDTVSSTGEAQRQGTGAFTGMKAFHQYVDELRLERLPASGGCVHLFRHGIQPSAQDPRNVSGCQIRFTPPADPQACARKDSAALHRFWVDMVLLLVSNRGEMGFVNGMSVDRHRRRVSVWLDTEDERAKGTVMQALTAVIPPHSPVWETAEYHSSSLEVCETESRDDDDDEDELVYGQSPAALAEAAAAAASASTAPQTPLSAAPVPPHLQPSFSAGFNLQQHLPGSGGLSSPGSVPAGAEFLHRAHSAPLRGGGVGGGGGDAHEWDESVLPLPTPGAVSLQTPVRGESLGQGAGGSSSASFLDLRRRALKSLTSMPLPSDSLMSSVLLDGITATSSYSGNLLPLLTATRSAAGELGVLDAASLVRSPPSGAESGGGGGSGNNSGASGLRNRVHSHADLTAYVPNRPLLDGDSTSFLAAHRQAKAGGRRGADGDDAMKRARTATAQLPAGGGSDGSGGGGCGDDTDDADASMPQLQSDCGDCAAGSFPVETVVSLEEEAWEGALAEVHEQRGAAAAAAPEHDGGAGAAVASGGDVRHERVMLHARSITYDTTSSGEVASASPTLEEYARRARDVPRAQTCELLPSALLAASSLLDGTHVPAARHSSQQQAAAATSAKEGRQEKGAAAAAAGTAGEGPVKEKKKKKEKDADGKKTQPPKKRDNVNMLGVEDPPCVNNGIDLAIVAGSVIKNGWGLSDADREGLPCLDAPVPAAAAAAAAAAEEAKKDEEAAEGEDGLSLKYSKSRSPRNRRKIRERKIKEAAEYTQKEMVVWTRLYGVDEESWVSPVENLVMGRPAAVTIDDWWRLVQACRKESVSMTQLAALSEETLQGLHTDNTLAKENVSNVPFRSGPSPNPINALLAKLDAAGVVYKPPPPVEEKPPPGPGRKGSSYLHRKQSADLKRSPKNSPRGGASGSPKSSPRSSPRNSPRSSPRNSPRNSPRSSPRSSPKDSPRKAKGAGGARLSNGGAKPAGQDADHAAPAAAVVGGDAN